MIIRKPYEFLIKNFRKLHIFLLLLFIYLYYSSIRINGFINEFVKLGTYDYYYEPITRYITPITIISIILMIIVSGLLLLLLQKKDKPWKLYLIPIFEYTYTLILYIVIINYFQTFNGQLDLAYMKAIKDFLFISRFFQLPVLIIYIVRILGVDLNKFNFKNDTEYLELDSDDQEELEINIQFDIYSIKRSIKRFFRNSKYVYLEHKTMINIITVVLILIIGFNIYNYIFVVNKSYELGDSFSANGYTIQVKESYYTNKDYNGNIIDKKNSFIILNLKITNNIKERTIDLTKFHIKNGITNYTYTAKTYGTEFQDYGKTYKTKKIKSEKSIEPVLVFKVDKKLDKDKFVLYYQEINNRNAHLRKIKLNLKDVSVINKEQKLNLYDKLTFKIDNHEETISIDSIEFKKNIEYLYKKCSTTNCETKSEKYAAPKNKKILQIDFATDTYESKELIDFLTKYGKINYIDKDKKNKIISIKNSINTPYYGKVMYIEVDEQVELSEALSIELIIRNNKYIYNLK